MQLEAGTNGGAGSASMNAAIKDVMPLFHAQLQESAAHGLDDSQMDARGKLDFQLVKDVVEQGHAGARAMIMIQLDIERIRRRVEATRSAEVSWLLAGTPRRCSKDITLAHGIQLLALLISARSGALE